MLINVDLQLILNLISICRQSLIVWSKCVDDTKKIVYCDIFKFHERQKSP